MVEQQSSKQELEAELEELKFWIAQAALNLAYGFSSGERASRKTPERLARIKEIEEQLKRREE